MERRRLLISRSSFLPLPRARRILAAITPPPPTRATPPPVPPQRPLSPQVVRRVPLLHGGARGRAQGAGRRRGAEGGRLLAARHGEARRRLGRGHRDCSFPSRRDGRVAPVARARAVGCYRPVASDWRRGPVRAGQGGDCGARMRRADPAWIMTFAPPPLSAVCASAR